MLLRLLVGGSGLLAMALAAIWLTTVRPWPEVTPDGLGRSFVFTALISFGVGAAWGHVRAAFKGGFDIVVTGENILLPGFGWIEAAEIAGVDRLSIPLIADQLLIRVKRNRPSLLGFKKTVVRIVPGHYDKPSELTAMLESAASRA